MIPRQNAVGRMMNEYVNWGGPIVTRYNAYQDMIARGFTTERANYAAFSRTAVPAPDNPSANLAFLRRITAAESAGRSLRGT